MSRMPAAVSFFDFFHEGLDGQFACAGSRSVHGPAVMNLPHKEGSSLVGPVSVQDTTEFYETDLSLNQSILRSNYHVKLNFCKHLIRQL